ncbi:MAG: ribonuclease HII [Rhodothermaceae bacterium]|nr:ribonuclease HII [Rhodothermaceae bacterium]
MIRKQVIRQNYHYEEKLWNEGFRRVMGLDEVGRGCLAGPVVAAGVILVPGSRLNGIRDSKKLSAAYRQELAAEIREKALFWTVQESSVAEISEINILKASLLAMRRCTEAENASPEYLLVDGNAHIGSIIPGNCIIGGDDLSASIGAASILAKVYRDRLMVQMHELYPHYGWNRNVGYPTRKHKEGLRKFGFCKYHRTGFRLGTDTLYIQPQE